MNSDDAVEAHDDHSRTSRIVSEWYALNPDIRQLRVYEADEAHRGDVRDVYIVVALSPVCDSDDVSPIWLAKYARWQEQLQALIGRRVHLDWFDGDIEVPPCAEGNGYARACLASIAWRDCCTAPPDFMSVDISATPSSNRPGARHLV
jgi:hypothetical protein